MIQKFKKKPVVIEALKWDGKNFDEVSNFTHNFHGHKVAYEDAEELSIETGFYHIETLEGLMKASPGDWIIKGVNGEFYPCKPDIFEKTYDVASCPVQSKYGEQHRRKPEKCYAKETNQGAENCVFPACHCGLVQSDSGVEEEDKAILDEAKTSGTIIHWFDKWCKESKRGGGVLITTSIKELLTDFYNDYASSKTKELVAEIEKLKELIEKLFKSTGNKIILNMWDEDINIVWEQFKTENNL